MDFRIDPDKCVTCLACVRVCPADAVAVDEQRVSIVDEACTRCGLCLPACPHEAIIAIGDQARALALAKGGEAVLILSVESAAHFYPATPEQVVNASYAAGYRAVHRGVLGDELVAEQYRDLFADTGWRTIIRSTCPVVVETVRTQYPELVPYLAPVATPIAAEARYLKALYGADTPIVYAGVCITEGGADVDAAITFAELEYVFAKLGVTVEDQPLFFHRIPEERRRFWSTAGGLPIDVLKEERQSSKRFRKVRGLGQLEAMARAVTDKIDLGFVDILPCEGCLDHPLLGPKDQLFRRREIVGATEPQRAPRSVLAEGITISVGAVFKVHENGREAALEVVEEVLEKIGLAPNGRPWDCGACGYDTCQAFAIAAAQGRTTLKSCPPHLNREATAAHQAAAVDALTGLASFRVLRDRLATEVARARRTGERFAVLFMDLDNFKQVNDVHGHEAGDRVLVEVGRILSSSLRASDLAIRWGGDEFLILLPDVGVLGATAFSERTRMQVEALSFSGVGRVTLSAGVVEVGRREDPLAALRRADTNLYEAKVGGRNRVTSGTDEGDSKLKSG